MTTDSATDPQIERPSARRHPWKIAAQISFTALLLAWLLTSGSLDFSVLANLGPRWNWFLAALAITVIIQLLTAWRWHWILQAERLDLGLGTAIRVSWIGSLFNQMLFGTVGGDVYRIYRVDEVHRGRRTEAITTVLFDRVSGLWSSLLIVLLALPWCLDLILTEPRLMIWIGIALGILILPAALIGCRPWSSKLPGAARLARITKSLQAQTRRPGHMARVMVSGAMIQFLVVLENLLLAVALFPSHEIALATLCLTVPLALFAMALPINPPGAIGTGEAIYHFLLGLAGIPNGAMLALAQRLILVVQSLPGAVFYLLRKRPT